MRGRDLALACLLVSVTAAPSLAADAPTDMIRWAPSTHTSLLIPKGWASCNAAANALLGNPAIPADMSAALCKSQDPVALFTPREQGFMVAFVSLTQDKAHLFDTAIDKMTDAQFQDLQDRLCKDALTRQSLHLDACTVDRRLVNGSGLVVVHGAGTQGDDPQRAAMQMVLAPSGDGTLIVVLCTVAADEAANRPVFDAMVNSITTQ